MSIMRTTGYQTVSSSSRRPISKTSINQPITTQSGADHNRYGIVTEPSTVLSQTGAFCEKVIHRDNCIVRSLARRLAYASRPGIYRKRMAKHQQLVRHRPYYRLGTVFMNGQAGQLPKGFRNQEPAHIS